MAADVVVVGGGLVGLASALALVERAPGLRLTLFEKEPRLASHQSGHNSGVVHSGLYYAPGSLKASLCHQGRAELQRRGAENGIQGLAELDEAELREIEPHARGVRALHVPETAVVDFRLVAERMAERLRSLGARLELGTLVTGIAADGEGLAVTTTAGRITAGGLVACAGLQADRVAALAGVDVGVRVVPFRGAYWKLRGRAADLVR